MTATISTHILNGADGSHAGGIAVRLVNIATGAVLFEAETDDGGRLTREVDLAGADTADRYEICFSTGIYWSAGHSSRDGPQVMDEVALRFRMPDPDARYHLPVIISPNACSCWLSAPEQAEAP